MIPAAAVLLAETRRRPGRVLLTGLAVLVATMFAAGTLLLGGTLRTALTEQAVRTPAGAAAVATIGSLEPAAAADLVAAARALPGATAATGVWSGYQPVRGATGSGNWQLSSDPMTGPLTRLPAGAVAGRLPAAPDEVAAGVETARRAGLAPGAVLTVGGADGAPRTVTVTGIVTLPQDGINTLVAAPDTVAALGGQVDRVEVAGADPDALARGLAALAPDTTVRTAADQRAAEVAEGSATANAVVDGVLVFTGLAMIAAIVVVASTFRIVLTQRRTQLALLRCVGARRRQVVVALLVEAAVSGLVAGLLGVGVAIGAGYGVVAAVRASGSQLPDLVVSWPGLAGCVLLAVVATVAAAVAPAVAASRIPPVAALGAAGTTDAGAPRRGRRFTVAGVLVVVAAGLAAPALQGDADPNLALVGAAASGLALFAAVVALGPLMIGALAATVGRVVALLGRAPGRMAVANAAQVPRRTAATVTVLALGVGLTSALLVAVAGVASSGEQAIAERLPAAVAVVPSDPAQLDGLAGGLAADPALLVRVADGQVLVDPAAGVGEAGLRAAVDARVAPGSGALVVYTADVRAELTSELGTAQAVGLGLVGMTMLVALIGVGVTLMLSVAERTRETGLLRAVGLTRGGVRAMVAWEAALGAIAAAVLGAALGAGYGLLATRALGLGDGVAGAVPVARLALLAAGVVVVAVLAAVVPAIGAGRVAPTRALADA